MTTPVRLPVLDADAASRDAARRRCAEDLAALVEGEVRFGAHDRMLYATDASIYQVEPVGVVVPRTMRDVERTVAYCAEHGIPVLPRGGGTSLAGQAVNTAVVLDFSPHLRSLVDLDVPGRIATVEPGIVLNHLNAALAPHGLMFGPDVATSTHATIGGMIGNNSAGAHSVLYGRTVEHLVGVDVVLGDGRAVSLDAGAATRDPAVRDLTERVAAIVEPLAAEIDARFPTTRRHVDGYNLDLVLADLRASSAGTYDGVNLARLLCGSEGTLGVTTRARLALVEAPTITGLAIVGFRDVADALDAVGGLLETGPSAVELVDDVIIDLARANLEHRRHVALMPPGPDGDAAGAVLYVEYFARDRDELAERFAGLRATFGDARVGCFDDADRMAAAWRLRKAGEPLLHGLAGDRKPITFVEDLAVDPDRLPEFVRRFRAIITRHGTTAAYYAHASVGCLHIRPMIALRDPADRATMRAILSEATDLVMEFGGALSGEHGDGRLRSHLLERFYGRAICDGFRAIKTVFDPAGLMNPGVITSALPLTEHLRIQPADRLLPRPEVRTWFRYRREHGFGEAVEMCNGAGVCRKTSGGTMCPSYRATRDERHATRGRGNALRLAITGQVPGGRDGPAWDDPETLRTLDLCLSCKACRSECPSNVDISKLKAEYLAHTYEERGGVPLAVRAIGAIRPLSRLAAQTPRLANAVGRLGPVRALLARTLDIDPRRSLPPVAPSLFRWLRRRPRPDVAADAPVVVFFADCFTAYGEPHAGQAAVEVLEALGYRVEVPDVGCCGRPMISTGDLAAAVRTGARTARALEEVVRRTGAVAVVGCEPSCVSAITDDWTDLDLGIEDALIDDLAARSAFIDDWIARRWDEHPRRPALRPERAPEHVVVHGHCHQKALWGPDGTRALLARAGVGRVELLDTGCCGMAGAFGFSRDRYDLSQEIAELALLPALRAAPDAAIVAPGTSCRHQIRDALGRDARQAVEILRDALA